MGIIYEQFTGSKQNPVNLQVECPYKVMELIAKRGGSFSTYRSGTVNSKSFVGKVLL